MKNSSKQSKQTKSKKKNPWIIVGIVVGTIVIICAIAGVLAVNGVFDDIDNTSGSCPAGKYKVCGRLGDGKTSCGCYDSPNTLLKPIIYLYPEKEMEVTVKLGAPERLTSSYPKYIDGWDVVAYPNGDLIDKTTGNKLYSLYWEGEKYDNNFDKTTGFVVKGSDSSNFLEEKLDILGLNYREKEEFIVYWLPKLEANAYNYIYFSSEEEIEKDMPLELSIKPDTLIRVRMVFEGLAEPREVKEQVLSTAPERRGFTVVEWGGINAQK